MLIGRCAWHPRYYGYPLLNGVASWRGFGVKFTDGICPRCLQRFRQEHHSFLERREGWEARPPAEDTAVAAASAPHEAA